MSYLQPSYRPADVPFQSLRNLAHTVRKAMIPDGGVKFASMTEGNDGAMTTIIFSVN